MMNDDVLAKALSRMRPQRSSAESEDSLGALRATPPALVELPELVCRGEQEEINVVNVLVLLTPPRWRNVWKLQARR